MASKDKDFEEGVAADGPVGRDRRPKVTVGKVRPLPAGVRLEDTKTCERCGGVGEICVRERWEEPGGWIECGVCGGTGRVMMDG